LAFGIANPSGEPIVKILKSVGYKADEVTARLVAEISANGGVEKSQVQTASGNKAATSGDSYDVLDAATDTVAVGVLMNLLGGF